MKKVMKLAALLSAMLFAAGILAQSSDPPKAADNKADKPPETVRETGVAPDYVIGADDTLHISVWKEPDLSEQLPVRPDGKISMPLLNDVQAAGRTPLQLGNDITAGLKKFITDPQVTVVVTIINSQRVFILGEVNRAGAYPLLPNMTVLQALSSAGGFTIYASLKKIYVLRIEDGKQVKHPFNYKDVLAGKAADQNILVKAGDTIVVP
jgi:polysaccharide export outer membrane protein